jgi:hypothetical protein
MIIYTYIPFMSTGDINTNYVKSFKTYGEASHHANMMEFPYFEIIENELD